MRLSAQSICIALVLLLATASAQVATGTPPFGSFGGGPFDVVNLGNLNVHFAIPVLHKPGRGVPFTYDLSYDSSVWTPVTSSGVTQWQPANNWGWRGQTEIATGYMSDTVVTTVCLTGHVPTGSFTKYSNWTYHDSFGTSHSFPGFSSLETGTCGSTITNMNAQATDGSGYTFQTTGGSGGLTIISRGGKIANPPYQTSSGAGTFKDSNGNEITVNTSGQFFDTLSSTTAVLTVSAAAPPTPTTFTYTAPSGGGAAYTMNYQQYTVNTGFGVSNLSGPIAEYGPLSAPLVSSITLPDGSSYTFSYEATPTACTPLTGTYSTNCVTARISSVTLPTGGTVNYAYSGGTAGTGIYSDGSTAGLVRALSPNTCSVGGCWQYTRALQSGAPGAGSTWKTTVVDPSSNNTVLNFAEDGSTTNPTYDLYETQRAIYQGSILPANLLGTSIRCYNAIYATCSTAAISSPISQMDAYTQLPSTSTRLSEVKYNTAGVVTDSKEYDYGVAMGAAPGNTKLIRETAIAYASLSNGIVDRPSSVTVKDWTTGTATTIASTTYIYDGGAVTGTTGTPQQVAIVGSRGNPTKITTSTSGTASLVKMLSYYDTGNLNVATDVNGALTTYVYGTLAATCGNSFPTTIDEPLSLSRSMTWDCTGGMATQTSDENGNTQQTNYTDPNFWRAANVFDQENNETTLSYFGRSAVESGAVNFNGGNSAADSRTTVDGFGRPIFTQRKQGPSATNYDTAEIDYNNLGQPNRSTMTYSAVASPSSPNTTAPATTTTYDALGRVLTVTDANNGKVTYTYTNNDVLQKVTGTQAFQKQLEYDGLGRLTSVCEISSTLSGVGTCLQGTSQTGYWTKYTYDALGRLLSVTQNAQAAMGSRQARSFVYDMVGRLRSESNPEAGNGVTNGTATYTYDVACATTPASPGDLTGKLDAAGNTTCYYYDSLHRLNGGGNTSVCRRFNYDNSVTPPAGVTVANTKTRLIEASTDNCGSTKFTDEWFSYSARGELSDVYESTPHSGSIPYHTTATYWPTGTLKSLGGIPSVPTIFYGASTGAGLDGEGRVTEVSASSGTNPVTNVTYSTSSTTNPLGALTGVTFGSADSDSFTYDPNTGRMATYRFSVNSHDDQGTLTWNTNGTLQKLVVNDVIPSTGDSETCNYLYDDLQRLSSSNCGALWSQTFTYDPFGNIKKSGSGGFNPLYSTTQNQFTSIPGITGPYYDMNGNLTKDNLNTYTWDPNWGNMLTVNTGSATVTATYDALGRMVENNAGGTFTQLIYGPTGAKLATANGSTLVKAFIALPGGAKAIYNSSGVLSYYRHSDWLGSSRLTSTQARALYSSSSYAPFGEQFALSGTTDASFTGQDQDTVSSLYDFPARRYSSSQGRWISPDPAGVAAVAPSNPQSWNRYTNVGNNPLNSIDPSGLFRLPCFTQGCIDGNGGAGGGSSDCEMDGVDVPCSVVDSVVEGGGATQCPDNDCSPVYANGSWMYFGAWADGSSGYLPIDFGGYSSADIAALRLVPNSDCSGPGSRRIDYEVKGAGSSGWFVTEQQVFPNGANYSDSSTFGGQFDDTIYGTYNGNSLQTFTVSRQDPTKGSGGASIGITVQLTIEPAQTKDFGTLGMWHGGLVGLTFIQGNSSGWAPCSGSYSRN